jgi:hypothetical protein
MKPLCVHCICCYRARTLLVSRQFAQRPKNSASSRSASRYGFEAHAAGGLEDCRPTSLDPLAQHDPIMCVADQPVWDAAPALECLLLKVAAFHLENVESDQDRVAGVKQRRCRCLRRRDLGSSRITLHDGRLVASHEPTAASLLKVVSGRPPQSGYWLPAAASHLPPWLAPPSRHFVE